MPFFSVIIPTFNRSAKVKKAIESVLSQTFSDFEILVMDDGSTDDTENVIRSINDPRVFYQWADNFGGPARPRNRGINIAKGEWVCFLDADDWWSPNKLETCLQAIGETTDLIYHDLFIVDEKTDSKKSFKSGKLKKPVIISLIVDGNTIANSSVVVRKSLLDRVGGINEDKAIIAAEDFDTWLKIANLTDQFEHIPKSLGYYLQHESGISQKDMSNVYETVVDKYYHLLTTKQMNRVLSLIQYTKSRHLFINGNYREARKYFGFCFRYADLKIKLKIAYMYLSVLIGFIQQK